MSAIILFYGVNLMGLRMSSQTQNVLMIIKIGLVVLLISSLFFPANYDSQTLKEIIPDPTWNDYIKSFVIELIAV
jgi:APA family basic amino acid/polyamine antiporter